MVVVFMAMAPFERLVFMGASSLALAVAFHAMRGMYLHAERLLAKAGGSNCKGRGISHPWNEAIAKVERA